MTRNGQEYRFVQRGKDMPDLFIRETFKYEVLKIARCTQLSGQMQGDLFRPGDFSLQKFFDEHIVTQLQWRLSRAQPGRHTMQEVSLQAQWQCEQHIAVQRDTLFLLSKHHLRPAALHMCFNPRNIDMHYLSIA